jgi:type IV pilus assembly protein PilY1
MKRIRATSFAFAALAGICAGLPITIHADDTEIYVGNRAFSAAVRPNVLLVLDTSGSMAATDGLALDRLDRVKVALDAILNEVNDMNIGLARFHTPGGPILFPVSYVDEDAQNVELGLIPEINQRLVGSENDAEQLGAGSVTVLDSPQLELTKTDSFGNEMSRVLSVDLLSSDDAEESPGGSVDTTRTVMDCCANTNGLRFQAVPIPQNAPILNARLEFVANAPSNVATTITFYGDDVADSPTFTTALNDLTGRAKTTATVAWTNVPEWDQAGDRFQSPNLKSIIQEIVDAPGWAAGNALSILFDGIGDRQARTYDFAGNPSNSAQLFVEYGDPATNTGNQLIGLRFNDVRVPQKQGIRSAVIEFMPVEDGSGPVMLEFHGEAIDDSAPFTAAVNDISARTPTLNQVSWDVPAANWKEGVAQTSPDLTTIVQEIVNRPGWCGGNAMTFGIDDLGPSGPRIAAAFDGDPGRAPLLRIDFDTTNPPGPGEGCTIQEVTVRPSISPDDTNQNLSDSAMGSADPIIQMDATKANGLRFQDVSVPPGVTITDARLVFQAADPGSQIVNPPGDPATITFTAHAVDTAGAFVPGAGTDVISRPSVVPSVAWSPPVWTVGDTQTSPDLSTVIDAVVNGVPGWVSNNDLAILMSTSGTGSRNATSHDVSPADAPQLRITMRAKVGDLPSVPVTTVRQRLKQIINELDHNGTTPIVDNLHEAAAYFRGEAVKWGLNRGTSGDSVRRSTRVSHPASYTGGTVVRDPLCTDVNLDAQECVTENITGSPTYISPIETECQANFIVLLTDGIANRNSSKSLIQNTTGLSSCSSTLPPPPLGSGGSVSSSEQCGLELTSFLSDPANDQSASVPGPNNVTTYTIGLNISNEWLKQIAAAGGGKFYEAGSTQELRKTFNDITTNILQRTASFATPSLSVNAFNRLLHLDEVYFSLFEPVHQVAWPGNVKKYKICADTNVCQLGEILDANDDPAIGTDGRILPTAKSYWIDPAAPTADDGAEVLKGGAGNTALNDVVPPPRHENRRVLTFTTLGGAPPAALDAEHEVRDDVVDGILDGLTVGTADERLQDTKDLLGWPGDPVAILTPAERADLVTALHNHIQWIRGQDVDDEDGDGDTTEDRYSFNDPLHSSAVAFTMAGSDTAPVVKVVVGTNDGGVRFINGSNGVEEFIFYPQSTLRRLPGLRDNPAGPHRYGMDGTATIWLNDVNKNGIIKPNDGDFAHVIIGQRRGGNEIISLDVTPKASLGDTELDDPDPIDHINPIYNWRIRGGSAEYPRLGQTWSRAKLATVMLADPNTQTVGPTTALLFAGGYDDIQDAGFGPGGLGNAIYMANPLTGERWLSISEQDPGSGSPDRVMITNDPLRTVHEEPKMIYPIPSDLALLDSNGDGNTNRLYVADTGGQVWRVDLAPADPAANTHERVIATVGRLATVSSDQTLADQRKFFEPPDVVQVRGGAGFSSVANYDLVSVVSGNRANPLSTTTQDRFYAIRDIDIGSLSDGGIPFGTSGHGNAAGFTSWQGALDSPFTTGDLFDVTNVIDPQGTDLANLQNAKGYYFDLTDPGEKGLSSPIVLGGTVFFTTYLPEKVVNVASCSLAEGSGLLYGINVLNGTAVFNWDQSPPSDPLSIADRRMALGSGIPSSAVPIFQPGGISLLIGGSSGATVVDPGLALPRSRTFWFEEAGR